MADIWDEHILQKPNWKNHIQHFFSRGDIGCMSGQGIDLSTYYGVRLNADRIHFHTQRGTMPPQSERSWSGNKVKNFYNWMRAGYPEEEAQFHIFSLQKPSCHRLRKSIKIYENDESELDLLKKAFKGLMDRHPDDPNGYFRLAGLHWLPAPALYCRHHENAYNPWHRAYLIAFEDALRSVEGCEEVTLPYWDIQGDYIPDFIWEEPFDHYVFPVDVANHQGRVQASAGDRTDRKEKEAMLKAIREYRDGTPGRSINDYIQQALGATRWQKFNGWHGDLSKQHEGIIRAHDLGHGLCGTRATPNLSLAVPNFAAFDPLFWLFHCNWDRLWWRWQRTNNATNVASFRSLAENQNDPTTWIDDHVIAMLQPFDVLTEDVINILDWNIDYTIPADEKAIDHVFWGSGSSSVLLGPKVHNTKTLSLRVKGINRLKVPGSFTVEVLADSETIAETYVFQSDTPQVCLSCTKSGLFSVDFMVNAALIEGKTLGVRVVCLDYDGPREMGLEKIGSPSVNVRVLLQTEKRAKKTHEPSQP